MRRPTGIVAALVTVVAAAGCSDGDGTATSALTPEATATTTAPPTTTAPAITAAATTTTPPVTAPTTTAAATLAGSLTIVAEPRDSPGGLVPPEAALATADYLSLSVTVPRLEGHPDPSVQQAINTRLKEHVDRAESAFVTAIAELQEVIVADGGSLDELPPSQYVLDYTVGLIADQALSIRFDEFSYTIGAANPANAITAVNVDLETGMPLELTDVFTGEEFAFALDELARQQLIATLWQGDEAGFMEWVGDAAVIADFEHWSLSPAGLVMAWDEFAVGPGVLGAPSVLIPWSSIGVYVDGDGPAGPFVSG